MEVGGIPFQTQPAV
uniref:Uncharacterized protein n=1 Tax=Nymphaea colorata TaxID=210225 RepID=A0A5K1BA36_9MAGN